MVGWGRCRRRCTHRRSGTGVGCRATAGSAVCKSSIGGPDGGVVWRGAVLCAQTPLMFAAFHGRDESTKLLLQLVSGQRRAALGRGRASPLLSACADWPRAARCFGGGPVNNVWRRWGGCARRARTRGHGTGAAGARPSTTPAARVTWRACARCSTTCSRSSSRTGGASGARAASATLPAPRTSRSGRRGTAVAAHVTTAPGLGSVPSWLASVRA